MKKRNLLMGVAAGVVVGAIGFKLYADNKEEIRAFIDEKVVNIKEKNEARKEAKAQKDSDEYIYVLATPKEFVK